MVKPLLDEVTVNKIFILGSSYMDKLLEYISPENLPVALGGKCKCEGGCANSDVGPWTEPEFMNVKKEDVVNSHAAPGSPIPA